MKHSLKDKKPTNVITVVIADHLIGNRIKNTAYADLFMEMRTILHRSVSTHIRLETTLYNHP